MHLELVGGNEQMFRQMENLSLIFMGNYVIYQPFGKSASNPVVHAGEDMEIQVFDDAAGSYVTKDLKVMAVVTNADPYGRTQFSEIGVCLLDKTFKELYLNYNQMIASVALDSNAPSQLKEQQEEIKNLMRKYTSYQITFSSRYDSRMYFEKERNTSFLVGLFFAVFFGIIGITNMINSIPTIFFATEYLILGCRQLE